MLNEVVETSTSETPDVATEVVTKVEDSSPEGDDEEGTDEGKQDEKVAEQDEKVRKQSRLDKRFKELTGKVKASLQEVQAWKESLREVTGQEPPDRTKFNTLEEYHEAVEDYRDTIRTPKVMLQQAERTADKVSTEYSKALTESWNAKVAAASDELPDFHEVVGSVEVPLANVTLAALQKSNVGPQVAYYLATNEDVAEELSSMSPEDQLLEIGRLESRVQAGRKVVPAKVVQTKAPIPPPTAPLRGTAPTRAKSPGDMSLKEFAAWRAKGGGK